LTKQPNSQKTTVQVIEIPLENILEPVIDMRDKLANQDISELAASISAIGLIQPIVVKQFDSKFEIIAGWRRFSAQKQLGKQTIKALVIVADDTTTQTMRYAENYQRKEVNPIEEGLYLSQVQSQLRCNQKELAKLTRRSEGYISDHIAVIEYSRALLDAVQDSTLTFSVAREFHKVDDLIQQDEFIRFARQNGCTPDTAKYWVRNWKEQRTRIIDDNTGFVEPTNEIPQQIAKVFIPCAFCTSQTEVTQTRTIMCCIECYNQAMNPTV
jgi:ParB/RepB/Spo0J family partition protein